MKSRTSVAGLLLEAAEDWAFSTQHGVILGQRTNDPGMLRLTSVSHETLTQPVSHDQCFEIAQREAHADGLQPIAVNALVSVTGPFGAVSFQRERDFVRVWYCCRPAGVIFGTYSCPSDVAGTAQWRVVSGQCARIVYGALFDRPSWAAQDVLTQALIPRPTPQPPAVEGSEPSV